MRREGWSAEMNHKLSTLVNHNTWGVDFSTATEPKEKKEILN